MPLSEQRAPHAQRVAVQRLRTFGVAAVQYQRRGGSQLIRVPGGYLPRSPREAQQPFIEERLCLHCRARAVQAGSPRMQRIHALEVIGTRHPTTLREYRPPQWYGPLEVLDALGNGRHVRHAGQDVRVDLTVQLTSDLERFLEQRSGFGNVVELHVQSSDDIEHLRLQLGLGRERPRLHQAAAEQLTRRNRVRQRLGGSCWQMCSSSTGDLPRTSYGRWPVSRM